MRQHILIIGKEWRPLIDLRDSFKKLDMEVFCTSSCQVAFDLVSRFSYSLIIIDFSFSEKNKVEFIQKLRKSNLDPILVFSVHATRQEEVQTLNAGADYYINIGVPMDVERCLANAQAILRRGLTHNSKKQLSILFSGNELKINPNLRKAFIHGQDLHLTPLEFVILSRLVDHMGEVVSKEQLYQEVWANKYDISSDAALKYHIKELRKKLGTYGIGGLIETAWGIGYLINIENG